VINNLFIKKKSLLIRMNQ